MAIWWSETNNWDLHAVVRGCSLYSTPTTTTSSTDHATAIDPFAPLKEEYSNDVDEREDELDSLSAAAKDVISELEQLCKPPERASTLPEQPQARRTLTNTTPRNKKRKNQQTKKVVCKVPASGVTSDLWAWRKYGQKPIKGSPYPRGYYRCSSSKGCMARKQVERSRTDPSVFVITYSAEHDHPPPTHRNSLAGSTRSKFPAPSSASDGGVGSERCASLANYPSPSVAAGELSPRTPLAEELMGKNVGTERSADLGESRKHSGSSADDSEEEEDEEDFVKSFFSSR